MIQNTSQMPGQITLITGAMFSGKTTELLRLSDEYKQQNIPFLMIKYSGDIRYQQKQIQTHLGFKRQAVISSHLFELQNIKMVNTLFIDEGQFFSDLVPFCNLYANKGYQIYVSALNSDFRQLPFENISKLFAISDNIIKLNAICYKCNNQGIFSYRKSQSKEVQLIGGSEAYIPTCRKCFNDLTQNDKFKQLCQQ